MALPIGVGIVAERKSIAAALSEIIEGDKELLLVGSATSGSHGHDLLKMRSLRVLLVNVSGVTFIREAKTLRPDAGIVLRKRRIDEQQARAALDAGADACCLATASPDHLCNAIKAVADGATWLDAEISQVLFHPVLQPANSNAPRLHLSPREHDILQLIVEGYSNEEIAALLKRSAPTVRTHLAHLYRKLGVNDRVSAAVRALRHGLV
jgi:DNA-binding NarL/FixJ family response regulator